MSDEIDFGEPTKVDAMPARRSGPGRQSLEPAMKAWLAKLEPGATYELASEKDAEGNPEGHGLNRVTRLRELAGETVKIETRTLKKNRYRVFATVVTPEVNGPAEPAKGTAAAKAAAKK